MNTPALNVTGPAAPALPELPRAGLPWPGATVFYHSAGLMRGNIPRAAVVVGHSRHPGTVHLMVFAALDPELGDSTRLGGFIKPMQNIRLLKEYPPKWPGGDFCICPEDVHAQLLGLVKEPPLTGAEQVAQHRTDALVAEVGTGGLAPQGQVPPAGGDADEDDADDEQKSAEEERLAQSLEYLLRTMQPIVVKMAGGATLREDMDRGALDIFNDQNIDVCAMEVIKSPPGFRLMVRRQRGAHLVGLDNITNDMAVKLAAQKAGEVAAACAGVTDPGECGRIAEASIKAINLRTGGESSIEIPPRTPAAKPRGTSDNGKAKGSKKGGAA